ncbi:MAG: hypothetical protein CME70_19855 [Halobacteriovorax sp.]|nr:hypothetical protein [Halobacteriovorax sp.]
MKQLLLIFLSLSLAPCYGAWTIHFSNNFSTEGDDVDNFDYGKMDNAVFIGASLTDGGKLYVGWTYMMLSRNYKSDAVTNKDEISTTQMGPKFLWYLNDGKNIFLSANWLPFAKGERKRGGNSEDIDGSGLHFALGYQMKINRKFYVGASFNYHSLSVSEVVDSGNNLTEPSQSYTSMIPMIDLSFHFK